MLMLTTPVAFAAEPSAPAAAPLERELVGFVDTLTCGQDIQKDDGATGTLSLRFECFGDSGRITWGFKMSPQLRALMAPAVGSVSEDGMIWFTNGVRQPKNAPHLEDGTYFFHGTLPGVRANDKIDYQDYYECRTADGHKGTLAVAGSLYLKP